ncbi:hypothetical protein J6590_026523 [Homalodisca vitripennis]|nr:hypothetical protein J6590_026523 [Homalodisca vitripennis]
MVQKCFATKLRLANGFTGILGHHVKRGLPEILETVPCWRPATITPHQQGGALITEQTVTIWVSVNLSSPLSLRKNLVVLALYQYSRPSPLSEADNIANPRGEVHAGWGKYPSAASLFDQLTNPAQSVSFTAATRSVEPVSTELLSLPARACFTGHRVQQNE